MWDPIVYGGTMPEFHPPKAGRFWDISLTPVRKLFLKKVYGIAKLDLAGRENLAAIRPTDGLLFAPNHSHDSDPHVMIEIGKRLKRKIFFMAAWQLFKGHKGIDGWVMQRMGAFSVDREGADRRAMSQAMDLMAEGKSLVIFPEGEVYRLNERLTPIKEGVAFMAIAAQKQAAKTKSDHAIWIIPTAIRYRYLDDIRPALDSAMKRLEKLILLKPAGLDLHKRLVRFADMMLTIKEKERFGQSYETQGNLPWRVSRFVSQLLETSEQTFLKKTAADDSVPLRVKSLRRALLEIWNSPQATEAQKAEARAGLDDVQLALQLFGYQGDYATEDPTPERLAEQIEKLEEDLLGEISPKGPRHAVVRLAPPIDLRPYASGKSRSAATTVSAQLESAIAGAMKQP